jgi:cellulose synthase/poly-beta-1,6-N-acetylglucosamine synthase-like glycosyltransferase
MREVPARADRREIAWRAAYGSAQTPLPRRGAPPHPLPLELAPFDGIVDDAVLDAAARRAERLGIGGDEVLRAHNILTADEIAAGIADYLGLPLDPLVQPSGGVPLAAAQAGVLMRGDGKITVAPRGSGIRKFAQAIAHDRKAARDFRIAAPERLAEHVRAWNADALADEAVYGLKRRHPHLSALGYGWTQLTSFTLLFVVAVISLSITAPAAFFIAIEYFLALSFIGWTVLRALGCLFRPLPTQHIDIPDRFLPVYTIIVPLYREAEVAGKLVAALKRLDYPPEKLDIKLMLEEDDWETRLAVAAAGLTGSFEIISPPEGGPRTKPKALAAALPFVRGQFVTVYDAEDEPEPRQLRAVLAAFAANPQFACVQAKLTIDNIHDGWLSRHFALEYAGQFEVFLPALARFGLPIPLGGTSNHFRTRILRAAGGWDPFNVTEDADLGMRLARLGHRIGTVNSLTWEEAPVGAGQWLRQRTRWFKGWMQTWLVHMRHPLRLAREMGLRGFLALQLTVGGTVLSALVHPFFMGLVLHDLAVGDFFAEQPTLEDTLRKWLAVAVLIIGYVGAGMLGIVGLKRRGLLRIGWILLTLPLYWLMLSAAALRALYQLVRAPYQWEKTPHGLARSSLRRGRRG